jgi:hypothetical protein
MANKLAAAASRAVEATGANGIYSSPLLTLIN